MTASWTCHPLTECLLTLEWEEFLTCLLHDFKDDIDDLYSRRILRQLDCTINLPTFDKKTADIRNDTTWCISPLPCEIKDRRIDLGDVSPCDINHLKKALSSSAQGIQVDFDDGFCPTWENTLKGHWNLKQCIKKEYYSNSNKEDNIRRVVLLIRPRAWNMHESNVFVNGKAIPGPLMDFSLHIIHNGRQLRKIHECLYFYLSKLEDGAEASLWNKIFIYTELYFKWTIGTIKATVLIENVTAVFQMNEILFALRDHIIGLNCGMWDYTASFIARFSTKSSEFILPDRKKYINMTCPFLRTYMNLLIDTCHRRKAIATTGMIPHLYNSVSSQQKETILQSKQNESEYGADGTLVFDIEWIEDVHKAWSTTTTPSSSQSKQQRRRCNEEELTRALLTLPCGDVTQTSVVFNLYVLLGFVQAWIQHHRGTFVLQGCIEDSATAEIARSQLWQWIHFQVPIKGEDGICDVRCTPMVVARLLKDTAAEFVGLDPSLPFLCWQILTTPQFVPFLTTYLLNHLPQNELCLNSHL